MDEKKEAITNQTIDSNEADVEEPSFMHMTPEQIKEFENHSQSKKRKHESHSLSEADKNSLQRLAEFDRKLNEDLEREAKRHKPLMLTQVPFPEISIENENRIQKKQRDFSDARELDRLNGEISMVITSHGFQSKQAVDLLAKEFGIPYETAYALNNGVYPNGDYLGEATKKLAMNTPGFPTQLIHQPLSQSFVNVFGPVWELTKSHGPTLASYGLAGSKIVAEAASKGISFAAKNIWHAARVAATPLAEDQKKETELAKKRIEEYRKK